MKIGPDEEVWYVLEYSPYEVNGEKEWVSEGSQWDAVEVAKHYAQVLRASSHFPVRVVKVHLRSEVVE